MFTAGWAILAVDIYRGRIFVAASEDGSVQVLDIRHNSVLDPLLGIVEPHSVAFVKASDRVFVSSAGDGAVRSYEGDTLKFIGSLRLGPDAGAIRVGGLARPRLCRLRRWRASGSGCLRQPAHRHSARGHPESFQCAETQPWIFVNLPDARSIAVVDCDSGKLLADWPVKEGMENFPHGLRRSAQTPIRSLSATGAAAGSGHGFRHSVGSFAGSRGADDLFYDAIHARLYAVSGEGHITVYAQETADRYGVASEVPTVAGARTGLFVPEWNRLFWRCGNLAATQRRSASISRTNCAAPSSTIGKCARLPYSLLP